MILNKKILMLLFVIGCLMCPITSLACETNSKSCCKKNIENTSKKQSCCNISVEKKAKSKGCAKKCQSVWCCCVSNWITICSAISTFEFVNKAVYGTKIKIFFWDQVALHTGYAKMWLMPKINYNV